MELMNHPVQMAEFIQENAAPFDYSLFNAYYDAKGKLLGFLIIASLNPITPFDKDIAGIIVQALQVTSRKVELPVRIDMPDNSDEAMLMKLLTGEEPALSEIYFKAMYPSMTEARFHVVVAQPPHDYGLPNARKRLFELFDQSVIAVHNHQIILLVWDDETSPEPEFVNKLSDLSRNTYLRFAVSNPFLRLLDGRYYLDQATYALGASATQDAVADAGVTLFKDVAISYITGDHEHESRLRARHPAVFALEQLDRKKDSDLLATLRTYLLCERSVNQAAEMLYVHRNTVMYRINQIKQLGILDLEDHRDRAYLMLSLFMDETESELSDANRDVSS
ncbi:MAG: PucR family transcriptional regulator [Coriobacteriales bacterium]